MRYPENPVNFISVFKVSWRDNTAIIPLYFTKSGNVYAFHGYSDKVLARAGGWGWDKESGALANALEKLIGVAFEGRGAGWQLVKPRGAKLLERDYNSRLYQVDKLKVKITKIL